MDQQRERIQADLRGLLAGEVRCDDVFTQLYASDASIYEIRPLGVIRPRNSADVAAVCRYAADNVLPIHPRGAGTGLAGESLGPGLVLDFSYGMRRIVDVTGDTVTVQPGVVLGTLNRYLASFNRVFGPDPATGGVTTLGSVLALDGSGSQWLRYGSARKHVISLQVVLADGTSFEASQHPVTDDPAVDPEPRRREIVRRLAELITREAETIHAHQPLSLVNRCGYHLDGILKDGVLDLASLLVGSEGTLALTTQATLRTELLPPFRGLVLLFFDRLEAAANAAQEIAKLGVVACDLVDRRILSLACDTDPHYARVIPRTAEAMLVVEQHAENSRAVIDSLHRVALQIHVRTRLATGFYLALENAEYDSFRRLSRRVSPLLYRLQGAERPTPFIEDIAIPPADLADFLGRLQKILSTHEVTASVFGHAGHGQLHIRPLLDLNNAADVRKMQSLANDVYEEVVNLRGTISGEHGAGLSRTWFLERQFGPLYGVFREVKRIFDPLNILNPGKVVADVPQPLTKNLRPANLERLEGESRPANEELATTAVASVSVGDPVTLELHLLWPERSPAETSDRCNGCGRCRTVSPETRMCPIFRALPAEEASPRAKANILRAAISGRLSPSELTGATLKQVADLCVNCHQCRVECPAGVDIPKLVIETKAQHVATNGLDTSDWFLSRLDSILPWAATAGPLVNWGLGNRWTRWLLQQAFGVASTRKLPRLAATTFLRRALRRRLTRPPLYATNRVLYFVDTFANWFDVSLAEAAVDVLERNGYSVYVPEEMLGSWMTAITLGDIERVRERVQRNVELLAEAARDGFHIVTTEPSAALALKHEYLHFIKDEDAKLVAERTYDIGSFLLQMHAAGKLDTDFRPISATIGYHLPCHLKVLDERSPGEQLLKLIPQLNVQRIDRGCSGMAGTFGLKRENFRSSIRSGWGLISAMRDPKLDAGVTECSACKLQMEQGTSKTTTHPIKLLAAAYGLLPGGENLLKARNQPWLVT